MPNEHLSLWTTLSTAWKDVVLAIGLSVFCGLSASLQKRRKDRIFSLVELTADVLMSGVAGFLFLMFCIDRELSPWVTGAIVGIAGHAAPRLLFLLDQRLAKIISSKLDHSDDDHDQAQ